MAVASGLDAHLKRTTAAQAPRDAVHLQNQELIIRVAVRGGWRALPEEPIDREARTSRAVDVLLERQRGNGRPGGVGEYALIEVWDWFDDAGAALREWQRRLDTLSRYSVARMSGDELPRTSGCWVVRATQRNRRLLSEHANVFRARFPGSARKWLATLTDRAAALPDEAAIVWVSVGGDRLFPVRWPRPDG